MSIPDVTAAARAADRAARALRQAVTRAVADGEKKTEVAAAAGVTRQTVDRWIAQEPAAPRVRTSSDPFPSAGRVQHPLRPRL